MAVGEVAKDDCYLRDVVTPGDLKRTITDLENISTGAMQKHLPID